MDADGSDEEGLLDIDVEDLNILDFENPDEESVEMVIDDPSVHPVQSMETEDVEPTKAIKWSKKCPPPSIPDPVPGLGRIMIQFRAEFPDPLTIFEMVCDPDGHPFGHHHHTSVSSLQVTTRKSHLQQPRRRSEHSWA